MVKSFTIRISDELNEWLEERAKREHRKKNNLVVHLLENARQDWIERFDPLLSDPMIRGLEEVFTKDKE